MKRHVNVGLSCATIALIGLAAVSVAAQQPAPSGRGRSQPPTTQGGAPPSQGERIGSNTPGPPAPVPTTVTTLGTVHLSKAVKADGQPLPAGTYQVRMTEREASPAAPGQTPQYERWAEFLQGGQVKGREVVTIVTPDAAKQVMKDTFPPAGGYRAEVLKGGDYYRLWFNKGGTQYLVHFNI
jgi:hypothetical protein